MISSLLYIDPGSGSYIVQALVAGALGVLYFFKSVRLYLRDLYFRIFKKKTEKS